jgi:hypothetical protein
MANIQSKHGKSTTVKSCLKGYFAMHSTFAISSVSKEISVIILAAEEDIPHEIKDSLINVWVGIVGNHIVGPYVLLPPDYVQNGAQEIRENKGIMLLLTITVVLICCLNLCCSLNNNKSLQISSKIHDEIQKTGTIKTKHNLE